ELSLMPLWFEALPPARAAALLADVLAVRRSVAAHPVAVARPRVIEALPAPAAILGYLAGEPEGARRVALDLRCTRTLVEATGNLAVRAVFRSIERLIREVPWMAEAFYEPWEEHDAVLAAMAQALASDAQDRA